MTTCAIVPAKPFHEGKSRLDGYLTNNERYQLNEYCLKNTLNILNGVPEIDKTIVISRDADVLKIARKMNASVVQEKGSLGLNKALYQVNNTLDKCSDRILIIPTDLPLLTVKDIQIVLDFGKTPPVVVVVPDRRNKGTNALLVFPPGCIRYRFGSNSSKKHVAEAQKRGLRVFEINIPGISLDLDLVEDLELYKASGYSWPIQALRSMEETIL
jgi:2-phospho-L-lactate guanylyltransferase